MFGLFLSTTVEPRFRQSVPADGSRWIFGERPGAGTFLLGVPFVAIGSIVAVAVLGPGLVKYLDEPKSMEAWILIPFVYLVIAGMGAFFAGIGLWFMFGRSGVELDRTAGRVVSWYGIFGLNRKQECALACFDRVRSVFRGASFRTGFRYDVALSGPGELWLELRSFSSAESANKFAEEVAHFLGMKLETTDSCS